MRGPHSIGDGADEWPGGEEGETPRRRPAAGERREGQGARTPRKAGLPALDARPSSDFVDGWLAGLGMLAALRAGADEDAVFFAYSWIGPLAAPRLESLARGFESDLDRIDFEVEMLRDWPREVAEMAEVWFRHSLGSEVSAALGDHLVELLTAHLGAGASRVFSVRPIPPAGREHFEPRIGRTYDHLLVESQDGRFLMEFAADF